MYVYLIAVIILGIIWTVLWQKRKDLHAKMLICSLLGMPLGLTNHFFIPQYWNPVVIARFFGMFDFESVAFSFFTSGIASVVYFVFKHATLKKTQEKLSAVQVTVIIGLMVWTVIWLQYVKYKTTFPVISALHILALIGIGYMWIIRNDLIKVSIKSGMLFLLLYSSILLMLVWIFPDFIKTQWSGYATFGIKLLGIPIDEFLYALFTGMCWSVVYEVLTARRVSVPKRQGG